MEEGGGEIQTTWMGGDGNIHHSIIMIVFFMTL